MNTFYQYSIQHPKKCILIFLVLTAIFSLGLPKLETKNSFDGELPEDAAINIDIDKVKEVFGDRSLILIGIETDDIYTEQSMEAIKTLSESVKEIPYVLKDEVKSLATVSNISLRDWGLESTGFIDEMPQNADDWNLLKQDVTNNQMVLGTLISEAGDFATVIAPLDDDFQGGEVYVAAKLLKENYTGEEQLHISGTPILVEDVQLGISKDIKKFIGIAILLVFIGFYLCFRSIIGVLLPLIMVVTSIVWTMGLMGYLGLNITVVSNALPVIMIAVASSYGIHFMNAYFRLSDQYDDKGELVMATLDKIGTPIWITGLTSSFGSLSLLVFNIHSLKEFGVIGAFGFFFATFICLGLMPAMCMVFKKGKERKSKNSVIQRFTTSLTNLVLVHKYKFLGAYLIVIPVALWFASTIQIGDDYVKFFPKSHDGRIAAEKFNESLDGVRTMSVMVNSNTSSGIKDEMFFSKLTSLQKRVGEMEHVGAVNSYVDVVSHIANSFNPGNENAALSDESIAQYLMLHEMSATPGEINNFYDEDYSKAHLQVLLKSSNPEDHENIMLAIKKEAGRYFEAPVAINFGGDVMHRIALGHYIVSGKIQNILLALLIVLLTTSLVFKTIKKGLFTIIPIVISLIMVFGFMGMMGIRLGISTSLLTAMIVGIGIDFSIHFLVSYYKNIDAGCAMSIHKTSGATGQAIAYDALSNIVGFSVLSISGFLPVQHFGWLLSFSMFLIFMNTLVVFPVLFGIANRKQIDNQNLNTEQLQYEMI